MSIVDIAHESWMNCDVEIRKEMSLFNFFGGSSMFKGLDQRFKTEMEKKITGHKSTFAPERKYSAWIGGSILVCLKGFGDNFLPKEKYDEYGPTLANNYFI